LSVDAADYAQEREGEFLADRLAEQARAAGLGARGQDICADCHDEIPAERRAAMPSAIRCINCQAWAERVSKIPNLPA